MKKIVQKIFPTLLQSCYVNCKTNSWFNIKQYPNVNLHTNKKEFINSTFINTIKIVLKPTQEQKYILKLWLNDCIDIYNATNTFLKETLTYKKPKINWINVRRSMNDTIRKICNKNNLNKHTGDYAVKHCVEMWKSAISNHKNIEKFNIRNLLKSRTRKNMVIEPASCNKKGNAIFVRELGEIESNIPLSIIQKNSVLQYNKHTDTFIIIAPQYNENTIKLRRGEKCGVDIGCRTFLTTYSENEAYEIGTSDTTYKMFKKYHDKIDSLNCYENVTKIKKASQKYWKKLKDRISDMHNKVASMLVKSYKNIIIGNVSTKKMISNLTGNLHEITKRRLTTLSHFRFRMKLCSLAQKYGTNVYETDEYLTSKTCCNCGNIKKDLTTEKTYNCNNCLLSLDRDINASINIYNIV